MPRFNSTRFNPLRPSRWSGLLLLVTLLLSACGQEDLGQFQRVVVQRDLLEQLSDWKRIEGPADALQLGTLTPSYSASHDAGDLPSLLLTPGTTASYRFPDGDGPSILRAAAGVDLTVPRKLRSGAKPLRLHFSAELDGESVMDQVILVQPTANNRKPAKAPQVWHWLGGKENGLAVRGGQTLTLRVEWRGKARNKLGALRLGFGGMVTESSITTAREKATSESPNIILVVMDTLRADRTSLHGYGKPTTPHLDRLAARGLKFTSARVPAPWTWPSTASLFTGLEPLAHGVIGHEACYLRHRLATLPKALQERGFTCAAFSGNPLIVPDKNFDAGFERFDWSREFTPGSELLPKALAWMEQNADKRFFLYLHLVDPHDPHRPLDEELARLGGNRPDGYGDRGYLKIGGKLRRLLVEAGASGIDYKEHLVEGEEAWIQDSYDACVATGDVYLGQLLDRVEELQLEDKTVIAFTSDHGEELFDHGLTNHAHTLHPELMDVPLVLAGPGIPSGVARSQALSNRHLATTLARLGGAQLPVPDALDLLASSPESTAQLFSHTTKGNWSDWSMVEIFGVLEQDWSFHWAPEGRPFRTLPTVDPGLGQWRLYDRRVDPTEQTDVSSQFPEQVLRLREAIEDWRKRHATAKTTDGFGAGAATRSLLEGVGYIDTGH